MNTSKIATLVILLLLVAYNSFAQNQNFNPEDIIEKRISKIQDRLDLDDLQTMMVKNILVKYLKEKIKLRSSEEERLVKVEKIKKINLDQTEELSKILTEEQLSQLKELQKEWGKKRGYQGKRKRRN